MITPENRSQNPESNPTNNGPIGRHQQSRPAYRGHPPAGHRGPLKDSNHDHRGGGRSNQPSRNPSAPTPFVVGVTKNGIRVLDRPTSHRHVTSDLLGEALAQLVIPPVPFLIQTVDMGRMVGESICVATEPGDEIVFARRENRAGLTRFVCNKKPTPCSLITIILKSAGEPQTYVLITAFIGGPAAPEPWDRFATPESQEFWRTHALVWGHEQIVPGTETGRAIVG